MGQRKRVRYVLAMSQTDLKVAMILMSFVGRVSRAAVFDR
jgi:hypothetical protein